MAIAIYYGEMEKIKIFEEKGIENNPTHIEAAILSYLNSIAKTIITKMKEKNEIILNQNLGKSLLTSSKNNNIKGIELLISEGVDINVLDIIYLISILIFLIKLKIKNTFIYKLLKFSFIFLV